MPSRDDLQRLEDKTSWCCEESELLQVLRTFGAEKDEEGNFKIYDKPVIKGMDGSLVVHGGCKCIIDGKPVPITSLLKKTSYGFGITAIGV
jgi:hypothetical protein